MPQVKEAKEANQSKYAQLAGPLRLSTDIIRPSYRGKISDFSLICDEKVIPDMPAWVETMYVYAPGSGVGVPGEMPIIVNGKEKNGEGQVVHSDYDELIVFFGSCLRDNTRLGGEIEAWVGEGENAEKFIIKDPTAMWMPKGLAHNPWICTKIENAKEPIIVLTIAMTPKRDIESPNTRHLPLPPAFSMDKLGVAQPGKGQYAKYVAKIPVSGDRVFPFQRTKVAAPTLMFDTSVIPDVPVWIEFFHIFAQCGMCTPTLDGVIIGKDGAKLDIAKGGGHGHNFGELFLYIPSDPHDTLNLGGIAESWLGEGDEAEGLEITKSSAVYAGANVVHNPQYWKRVDRPYFMVVIAYTKAYTTDEPGEALGGLRWTPTPEHFKW